MVQNRKIENMKVEGQGRCIRRCWARQNTQTPAKEAASDQIHQPCKATIKLLSKMRIKAISLKSKIWCKLLKLSTHCRSQTKIFIPCHFTQPTSLLLHTFHLCQRMACKCRSCQCRIKEDSLKAFSTLTMSESTFNHRNRCNCFQVGCIMSRRDSRCSVNSKTHWWTKTIRSFPQSTNRRRQEAKWASITGLRQHPAYFNRLLMRKTWLLPAWSINRLSTTRAIPTRTTTNLCLKTTNISTNLRTVPCSSTDSKPCKDTSRSQHHNDKIYIMLIKEQTLAIIPCSPLKTLWMDNSINLPKLLLHEPA